MPSTSHSSDSASRRWTSCVRCSSADSGSSTSFTVTFGFSFLKSSIAVPYAPLVSLPMHQLTLPLAPCPVGAFSASPPPPSSSSSPHATSPNASAHATTASQLQSLISNLPLSVTHASSTPEAVAQNDTGAPNWRPGAGSGG